MAANPENTDEGAITTISLDGSDVRSFGEVSKAHHDFAAIPGGIATILWSGDGSADVSCSLVEILDAGGSRTVVTDFATVYDPDPEGAFHTNSVHYHDADESYTLGDRNAGLYVKVSRDGELVWQLGGSNPKDPSRAFSGVMPWAMSHGHHLTIANTFALFNNSVVQNPNDPSYVLVYDLNTASMGATKRHEFSVLPSTVVGDVQLVGGAGGNYLVTTRDRIVEYTPTGIEVMTIAAPNLGYTEYRRSLYGAPEY
jgi:hypothetical protein